MSQCLPDPKTVKNREPCSEPKSAAKWWVRVKNPRGGPPICLKWTPGPGRKLGCHRSESNLGPHWWKSHRPVVFSDCATTSLPRVYEKQSFINEIRVFIGRRAVAAAQNFSKCQKTADTILKNQLKTAEMAGKGLKTTPQVGKMQEKKVQKAPPSPGFEPQNPGFAPQLTYVLDHYTAMTCLSELPSCKPFKVDKLHLYIQKATVFGRFFAQKASKKAKNHWCYMIFLIEKDERQYEMIIMWTFTLFDIS